MDDKKNKTSRINFRIDKDIKDEFTDILKQNGDNISGFLTRTIVKYVNAHKKDNE
jgi:antitoxin component of RelBE/YafQ-DinJ toxin-antitoxin module